MGTISGHDFNKQAEQDLALWRLIVGSRYRLTNSDKSGQVIDVSSNENGIQLTLKNNGPSWAYTMSAEVFSSVGEFILTDTIDSPIR